MGRWGHDHLDREDQDDGKPLTRLIRASRTKTRVRTDTSPRQKPYQEREREKASEQPSSSYIRLSATDIKNVIRELVLDDPALRPDDLAKELKRRHGTTPSIVTVSNIRAEFRGALRFLKDRGLLKIVSRKREIAQRNAD